MTAASDLYRTLILEHGKHPRGVGRLAAPTHTAEGDNPLCGDAVRVEAACAGDTVADLRFSGESCVLATASASLMCERLAGALRGEVVDAIAALEARCARVEVSVAVPARVADVLEAFTDVHRHPARIACALLPWRTLGRALGD